MFEILPHKRISEEIIEEILRRIRSGELKVGEKLPPERVLADRLGVSRTSLRDSLRTLENMGYIRSVKGEGNYVNSVSIEHVLSPFAMMLTQDRKLAVDIIQVRQYLETHMAALAARTATPAQIAAIYGAIQSMQAEVDTGENGINGDNQFHTEIARASQNKAFAIIVELVAELLSESRRATLNIPGQPAKTIRDHIAIFEAIQAGDEEGAAEAMRAHLAKARYNLVCMQEENPLAKEPQEQKESINKEGKE